MSLTFCLDFSSTKQLRTKFYFVTRFLLKFVWNIVYGVSHNKYLIFSPAFRMTKNNALCCMKNRAYGSVPVRYIPKKSYKVEDSKSLKSSEDEEIQDCVRIRASDGGRSYRTTFAWDEKNKIQDKKPMNNLIFDAESGIILFRTTAQLKQIYSPVMHLKWKQSCSSFA